MKTMKMVILGAAMALVMTGVAMADGYKKMDLGPKVVATQDGGVVLVSGNVMVKYDKMMKLVKQVELPCELMEAQCKMLMCMMEKMKSRMDCDDDKACPMMGGAQSSKGACSMGEKSVANACPVSSPSACTKSSAPKAPAVAPEQH